MLFLSIDKILKLKIIQKWAALTESHFRQKSQLIENFLWSSPICWSHERDNSHFGADWSLCSPAHFCAVMSRKRLDDVLFHQFGWTSSSMCNRRMSDCQRPGRLVRLGKYCAVSCFARNYSTGRICINYHILFFSRNEKLIFFPNKDKKHKYFGKKTIKNIWNNEHTKLFFESNLKENL